MKLFQVIRPFCNPECVITIAETNADAIAVTNETFGWCRGTNARELEMERGVLPSQSTIGYRNVTPHFKK